MVNFGVFNERYTTLCKKCGGKFPEWAKFIATDKDGTVYVFEKRPILDTYLGLWDYKEPFLNKGKRIGNIGPTEDWERSLCPL